MTTIYIVNKENNVEYNIGTNLIGAIKQMVADQRNLTTDEVEIVFSDTIDETAKNEKRLLNIAQVKQAAHVYGLEEEIAPAEAPETPVTVETPKEKNNNSEEENEMTTTIKMPKELGKLIKMAVSEIINKYTQPLTEVKGAYEAARDALKKIRETETDAVKATKDAYDNTEKGTIKRKIAALDLKAAHDHKKVVVGEAKLAYDTAKLAYDKLSAEMNAMVAEATRGVIDGYQPVVTVLNGEPVKKEEPVAEEPTENDADTTEETKNGSDEKTTEETENGSDTVEEKTDSDIDTSTKGNSDENKSSEEIIRQEMDKTDFGAPVEDEPAADAPVRKYVIIGFGKVDEAIEKTKTTLAASTNYHWVEDPDGPDMAYVVYDKATMSAEERDAAMKLFATAKLDPDRYMIIPAA